MRKKIGEVSVDSGQLLITDPCYIKSKTEGHNVAWEEEYNSEEVEAGKATGAERNLTYSGCCAATSTEERYGQVDGLSLCTSTGWGDGTYPVYAEIENGRILSVEILFDGSDEEEEEEEYDEEE